AAGDTRQPAQRMAAGPCDARLSWRRAVRGRCRSEPRLPGLRIAPEGEAAAVACGTDDAQPGKARSNQLSPARMGLRDAVAGDRQRRDVGGCDVGTFLVVGAAGNVVAHNLA